MARQWYEAVTTNYRQENPNKCPRCKTETVEEIDDNDKTSGYACPKCGLFTDRN